MSNSLSEKTILLISPQAWDLVKVSKHHYAITLAAMGNDVYFLNPPTKHGKAFEKRPTGHERLFQINYTPFFPFVIRFHLRMLYDLLMKFQVRKLKKAIGKKFDIVWCFEPNLFSDLKIFDADIKIFHPVDVFEQPSALKIASTADVIFSVSPSILKIFLNINVPKYFINHGLGKDFEKYALKLKEANWHQQSTEKDELVVGYVGNLLIKFLDRELLVSLVSKMPKTKFILIGPFEESQSSLKGDEGNAVEFIHFLKTQPNVTLTGPLGGTDLIKQMEACDVFLLCYTGKNAGYDLSNSHKILEYLSTGKPIISSPILAYKDNSDLISMPFTAKEETYPEYFMHALNTINEIRKPDLRDARLNYAISHSYQKQVNKIETILDNMVSKKG